MWRGLKSTFSDPVDANMAAELTAALEARLSRQRPYPGYTCMFMIS
jgi:hypothetical protein